MHFTKNTLGSHRSVLWDIAATSTTNVAARVARCSLKRIVLFEAARSDVVSLFLLFFLLSNGHANTSRCSFPFVVATHWRSLITQCVCLFHVEASLEWARFFRQKDVSFFRPSVFVREEERDEIRAIRHGEPRAPAEVSMRSGDRFSCFVCCFCVYLRPVRVLEGAMSARVQEYGLPISLE